MKKTAFYKPVAVLSAMLVLLSACLCGCQKNEGKFPVPLSSAVKGAFELCGDNYADTKLGEIYDCLFDTQNVNDLHKKYAIKCLRKDAEGYHVVYVGFKKILVLYFDDNAVWDGADKLTSIYTLTSTRAAFDKLQVGDNIAKVQAADTKCRFAFLNADAGADVPRFSDHYSEDGYHTHIEYDADLNISAISCDII